MILTAIIPVYGPTYSDRKEHLKNILQPHAEIKYVVVADSFEESDEITIRELIENSKNSDIQLIYGKYLNPGSARNAGIKLVETDWFCFWDSDDEPFVDMYLELIEKTKEQKLKVGKGGYSIADIAKHKTEEKIIRRTDIQSMAEHIIDPGLWRYVFDSKHYRSLEFPPLRMGEDQDYLVQALLISREIYILEKVIYSYKVGGSSQLTRSDTPFEDVALSLKFLRSIMKEKKLSSSDRDIVLTSYLKQTLTAMRQKKSNLIFESAFSESRFLLVSLLKGQLFTPMRLLLKGILM